MDHIPTDKSTGQSHDGSPVMATPANAGTAALPARAARGGFGSALREILETVVFALLIFLALHSMFRNFRVEGYSMEPSIHDGEYLIVDHLTYSDNLPVGLLQRILGRSSTGTRIFDRFFHPPRRGDIIVFVPPNNQRKDYIKRVIGLPGDTVEARQGIVYVNGHPLREPYIRPGGPPAWGPVTVGPGQLFVLGDNRGNSTDSRSFGTVPMKDVIGKAWLAYWPPANWGFIRSYDLAAQLVASF